MGSGIQSLANVDTLGAVIFYFFVYSFFGWMLENSYSLFTKKIFLKPNFLVGPFKPMYGFAPIFLLILIHRQTHWSVFILLCLFIPTLVEYVSGFMLERIFQCRYWDYSDVPFQFQGHICLPFSICWIGLSIACLKWFHPMIYSLYETIHYFWNYFYPVVILYFLAELFFAVRRHSLSTSHLDDPNNQI